MGDELVQQAAGGICGDSWWTNYPTRMNYLFSGSSGGGGSMSGFAPYCSGGSLGGDMGGYGWLSYEIEETIKGKLTPSSNFYDGKLESTSNSVCDGDGLINVFPEADHEVREEQRVDQQAPAGSVVDDVCGGGGGGLMDAAAAFEIMGFGLSPSSSTSGWSQQSLFAGSSGATDGNYKSILQAEDSSDSRLKLIQESKDWNLRVLNSSPSINDQGDDHVNRYLHDHRVRVSSYHDESFLSRHDHQPPPVAAACQMNGFLLNGRGPLLLTSTSSTTPTVLEDISAPTTSCLLGTPPSAINITHHYQAPSSNTNPILASMTRMDERVMNEGQLQGSASVCPRISKDEQQAFKRPRIETPSPLPTFKVRKEKLGDRITALQQLVSPFGKTDTASVLHEAIEYIKFLHDQVQALGRPYFKDNGAPAQHQHHKQDKPKQEKVELGGKQDLRRRGLCLVPLSSTFTAATETPAVDFWAPTFGSTFS